MDNPMSDFMFKAMSFLFKCRDIFRPREKVLEEVEIKPGSAILDFGCGPGSYSLIVSKYVGESGKVYALDIHPLAGKRIQDIAGKKGLKNIETIFSDCATGLPDSSIDIILLYDIFHMLGNPDKVLKELYRVLKSNGKLSFSDHHMKENDIKIKVSSNGLFKLQKRGKRTYTFVKE
jgi:ubiquinone/menaquinone biosynthesis C-methylase UbiE